MELLVDSNVILDIVTKDPKWFSWSSETLTYYADHHILIINPIIYAEVSVSFEMIEDVEEALPAEYFRRDQIPWEAVFLAGKCFVQYRKKKAEKRSLRYRTFLLAHTQLLLACRSLPVMLPAIKPISRNYA